MKRQPTDAQIETAIEWLNAFDDDGEPDNGKDIKAVVVWLDDLLAQRMIRTEARRAIERLRELVAAERVECAKLAEEYNGDGIEIADLIRRRPVVTY